LKKILKNKYLLKKGSTTNVVDQHQYENCTEHELVHHVPKAKLVEAEIFERQHKIPIHGVVVHLLTDCAQQLEETPAEEFLPVSPLRHQLLT